jgi:hypothetical protein
MYRRNGGGCYIQSGGGLIVSNTGAERIRFKK